MLNNWVNFWFFILEELWDLAQENLVNIQGSYGTLDQYLWMSAIPLGVLVNETCHWLRHFSALVHNMYSMEYKSTYKYSQPKVFYFWSPGSSIFTFNHMYSILQYRINIAQLGLQNFPRFIFLHLLSCRH